MCSVWICQMWLLLLTACRGPLPGPAQPPTAPLPGVPPLLATETAQPAVPAANPRETAVAAQTARPTPTPWFPITRYVAPSVLPYDEQETIWVLPVYACPEQSCLWLGDLEAGLAVQVTALSEDMQDCFVGGTTIQGWEVEGWVSCSRLSETKPEALP